MSYNRSQKTIDALEPLLNSMLLAYKQKLPNVTFGANNFEEATRLAHNIHNALNTAKVLKHDKFYFLRDSFKISVKESKVVCVLKKLDNVPNIVSLDSITSLNAALDLLIESPPTKDMSYLFVSILDTDDFFEGAITKMGLQSNFTNGSLCVTVKEKDKDGEAKAS